MRFLQLTILICLPAAVSCQQQAPSETLPRSAVPAPGESAANFSGDVSADAQPTDSTRPRLLLSREDIEAGWIQLFDGESLFGWQANNDVNWHVADGAITADSGEPGLLLTAVPFADYELRCDYRLEAGGNSGLFLRTVFDPQDPAVDCYELNMCDSHPAYPTGSIVGRKKVDAPVAGEGEWKSFTVRVEGLRIEAALDGQTVMQFEDDGPNPLRKGLIGLQMNTGRIEFRNIFLRPLGMQPIFNGNDLTGWREVPGSKSTFEVADGKIRATNGPGFLETEGTWGNFVLQAQAITNGKHLNSGIFFRAKQGTEEAPSHGYEFQIHNGYKDGDRTQPIDQGTGAIFRRAPARIVLSNDNEWFTATLVAHGPNFFCWVDGYPVTNWTDRREPSDNPREGLRLAPGHISLQGHDPTTDLEFRNLRISEYPSDE
jgi:hypothetical protein